MPEPMAPAQAARDAILAWYARSGRSLPFRGTTDPWAILVSEAMAQQTQAARAGEAWTAFMTRFPTAATLADATPADVLRAWQGLGYNRRALNLWRAARRIVEIHGGRVPEDLHALQALPGVGPYTARAVAAIAFGRPVGAVDTNVRRVLGRIVAGNPAILDARTLQAIADGAVPAGQAAAWTHALMDLGATVCTPRTPACARCPARAWCRFAATVAGPPDAEADVAAARRPGTRRPGTRRPTAFPSTSRWLRGRIVERLREAAGDGWTVIEAPLGSHDAAAVLAALNALADEGLIELDRPRPGLEAPRARLATA
jgi:A/G-specific adenine glycosylase